MAVLALQLALAKPYFLLDQEPFHGEKGESTDGIAEINCAGMLHLPSQWAYYTLHIA